MKIVMPGGTGQIGTLLARTFVADGHEVVVLSRTPRNAPWRIIGWDGRKQLRNGRPKSTGRTSLSTWPGGASTAATTPRIGASSKTRGFNRLSR